MDFSSKLLENAVNEIAQLPGIGKRTALRLALHLLKQPEDQTEGLAKALSELSQSWMQEPQRAQYPYPLYEPRVPRQLSLPAEQRPQLILLPAFLSLHPHRMKLP